MKKDYIRDYEGAAFGTVGGRAISRLEEETVKEFLKNNIGKLLLDVGTGSGRFAKALKGDARIIGIDTSREMIKQAVLKRKDGYELIIADATNLPFKDECFSTVLCIRVLKWIPEYKKAISEISRVLKPKGMLVLDVANLFGWELILRIPEIIKNRMEIPHLFKISKIKKVLGDNRLEMVECRALHKLPLTAWNLTGNYFLINTLTKIDFLLKKLTPSEFLSRSIFLKCIKK